MAGGKKKGDLVLPEESYGMIIHMPYGNHRLQIPQDPS